MSHESTTPGEGQSDATKSKDLDEPVEPPKRPIDRWIEALIRRANGGKQARKLPEKAKQDRMRPALLGLVAAVVVVIILLGLFSNPINNKRLRRFADHRAPNLGRPQVTDPLTPAPESPDRSVTPLMGADVGSQSDSAHGLVTESDLRESSRHNGARLSDPASVAITPTPDLPIHVPKASSPLRGNQSFGGAQPHTLGQIEFSDSATGKPESLAEVEARIAHLEALKNRATQPSPQQVNEPLSKSSLVFVSNPRTEPAVISTHRSRDGSFARNIVTQLDLSAGMRLMVRLQSAITTAVAAPVVAEVEYNYETDGEIVVPAGSKVIGKLEQANRSGQLSVRFTEITLPDGGSYGIDGMALALDHGPLKGEVGGKRDLARFVTRAATGVGVVAAQVVGMHGGLNGPINNGVLIRDRLT
ncbi:MAG TPA: hypothetical protein VMW38_06570, partial [Terriglobia bacterium]|nr:hypothetical protein [Terriglobia bacterium]